MKHKMFVSLKHSCFIWSRISPLSSDYFIQLGYTGWKISIFSYSV